MKYLNYNVLHLLYSIRKLWAIIFGVVCGMLEIAFIVFLGWCCCPQVCGVCCKGCCKCDADDRDKPDNQKPPVDDSEYSKVHV